MKWIFWLTAILFCLGCPLCATAQVNDAWLVERGFIDVSQKDTSLRVYLMYAQSDNLIGEAVYQDITKAWLRTEAATMLVKAQRILQTEYPGHSLIVYDAARPMSIQRRMWAIARKTGKTNYVANPARGGGLHNYGMAVDVSILDESGKPLDMGTPVDFLGEEAHTDQEEALLTSGRITREGYNNRQLLRSVMRKAGFRSIRYEWWHFNACSRDEAIARYPLID